MDDKKKLPLDLVSAMDQVSGLTTQVAMIESSYFLELVKSGTPYDLACNLVRDWHNMYWNKQFYPDGEGDYE